MRNCPNFPGRCGISCFYVLLYVHVCFAIYDLLPIKLIVMYLLYVKCWFNTMSWSKIGESNILSYLARDSHYTII